MILRGEGTASPACDAPPSQLPAVKDASTKKDEASALETETKRFLGRSSGIAERAAEYHPTLDYFSSVSFADYVRGTLLGVPLETEPEGPGSETAEVEFDEGASGEPQKAMPLLGENVVNVSRVDSTRSAVNPTPCPPPGQVIPDTNTTATNHYRTRTRSTATPKEESTGGNKASPKSPGNKGGLRRSKRAAARKVLFDTWMERPNVGSQNTDVATSKTKHPVRPPLLPSREKLADGIAKVTLPEGWWDHAGIANDLTARGPFWQPGTKLGDMLIASPIKQCASGIGGVYEYTMLELPPQTVSEFRSKADQYRKRQIGSEFDADTSDDFVDGLARKFWRRLGPTMEASVYGADMEGSLFKGAPACGWNVDRLENCLQLLRADAEDGDTGDEFFNLPGVTSAYLYFGMWASVFAAHTEDMNLLSINYLHAGSPKYWYSISPEDSQRFESLAVSHFAAAAASCPEFLRHKRYLLSPAILKKAGIKYKTQIQRAGDVVITFPGSYHFGFNTGFNIAESTNFGVPEWVPMGFSAQVCMCHPHSVRVDMARFKHLLKRYDADMVAADGDGIPRISYSEWAKLEAIRRKQGDAEEQSGRDIEENGNTESPKMSKKGMVVEVLRSAPRRNVDVQSPKKKSPKKKRTEKEDWRLALRAKSALFTPQTQVLCFLDCDDDEYGRKEKCFTGVIAQVVEGHARIHFAGLHRKEDIWMPINSPKLFLDGGPENPPEKGKLSTQVKKRKVF